MKKSRFLQLASLAIMLCLLFVTFTAAKRATKKSRFLKLSSIHIVDRNGLTETISGKDRLCQFEEVNFLESQSYQKVLRIYERDRAGNLRSIVTTYHENGNPKQFLEILNGRAQGKYFEWHENGRMAVATYVVGGSPDVTATAQRTWLFDGESLVWNDDEILIADIQYCSGSMEGIALYYHADGALWKSIPYNKNKVNGTMEVYRADGSLLQQASFCAGEREGPTTRYWCNEQIAATELFCKGKLETGQYFTQDNVLVAEVINGSGWRAIFGKETIQELEQYENGVIEGEVRVFNKASRLKRIYHVKDGIKDGEECEYFDLCTEPPQPRLLFNWYDGKIQGEVKSWYPNGMVESQKEMSNSSRNGVLTAWYKDGNLMMIEEYENDKLLRGDYFKKGERSPVSQVIQSKGTVTIYNADGHFVQKIPYVNGKPEV